MTKYMSKKTLTKVLALTLLPISLSVVAETSGTLSGEPELITNFKTRSGIVTTETYFYNGKWYVKTLEEDNLFGLKEKVILRGEERVNDIKALEKRIDENAMLVRKIADKEEHLISPKVEMMFSEKDGNEILSICVKDKSSDIRNLVTTASEKCDFNLPELKSFKKEANNTGFTVNTIKAGFSYNEIEFIVGEHQQYPLGILGSVSYDDLAVQGNMIFLK